MSRVKPTPELAAGSREDRPARTRGVPDQEAGLRTRLIFKRLKRRYGHVPLPARIRARDPKLLALSYAMNQYTTEPGLVPQRLKELAQLKVAAMVGCPF